METLFRLQSLEIVLGLALSVSALGSLSACVCAFLFRRRVLRFATSFEAPPPVTLLKPVYGLEKDLRHNLGTACRQDYPEYQVLFSLQRADDPALPLLLDLQREHGRQRVSIAVESVVVGSNGKVNNLAGALPHARHDLLVISDSDAQLAPDFLARVVAPLADPTVGAVSTFFRGTNAQSWFERLELLGLNAEQFAVIMLGTATGAADFCLGVSTALSKQTLRELGGFEALGNYLVEDAEMGRRIRANGQRVVMLPYVVDVSVDLRTFRDYAAKQVYWDQNTIAAAPGFFALGFVTRLIPLALVVATLRGWDSTGVLLALAATTLRLTTAALVLGVALRDKQGLASLWLLPLKDLLGVLWSLRAVLSRTVVWRDVTLTLGAGRRLTAANSEERRA